MANDHKITLKKVPYPQNITTEKGKDYYLHVNGEQFGHVAVDRAGRSSGTSSRWSAYDKEGKKVGVTTYTRKSMEQEVNTHIRKAK